MNVEKFQCVTDWLDSVATRRTGSQETRDFYIAKLTEYCSWRNTTPDQLLKEDVPYRKGKKKTVAERNVIGYFQYLLKERVNKYTGKKGLGRDTAKGIYGVLRSFFHANEVVFYDKTPAGGSKARSSYSLPKDKVKQTLDATNLPTKYAITGLAGTGMRPADFIKLTYGDVQEDYEAGEVRLYIEKDSQKEDLRFGVFLSRQATYYLRLMLQERQRKGERITKDTMLLAHVQEVWEGAISKSQLRRMLKDAGERVGLHITPKLFRKNFRTLASPVIGREAVCKMAAWTIAGVGGHYFLPPKEEALKTYRRIEEFFIYEQEKTQEEQGVQNLINFAIAQGLPSDRAEDLRKTFRSERLTEEEVAKRLHVELKQVDREGGGLAFEVQARKALADIVLGAIKDVKEKLAEKS